MNAKTCKMLRKAAGYCPGRTPTEYHRPEIHHLAEIPTYEEHERLVTSMGARGVKTWATITKIRYTTDGKRPAVQIMNAKGQPATTLIPIAKPCRLFSGASATKDTEAREPAPRHVYHTLKRLERMKGLDNVYNDMYEEATI